MQLFSFSSLSLLCLLSRNFSTVQVFGLLLSERYTPHHRSQHLSSRKNGLLNVKHSIKARQRLRFATSKIYTSTDGVDGSNGEVLEIDNEQQQRKETKASGMSESKTASTRASVTQVQNRLEKTSATTVTTTKSKSKSKSRRTSRRELARSMSNDDYYRIVDIEKETLNLERENTRLESWELYILVSVLTATASLDTITNEPDGDYGVTWFRAVTLLVSCASMLSGVYSTVVYSLCVLYGKSALGIKRDEMFGYFINNTGQQRIRAFQAFLTTLILFTVEISLVLCEHFESIEERLVTSVLSGSCIFLMIKDWKTIIDVSLPVYTGVLPEEEEEFSKVIVEIAASPETNFGITEQEAKKNGKVAEKSDTTLSTASATDTDTSPRKIYIEDDFYEDLGDCDEMAYLEFQQLNLEREQSRVESWELYILVTVLTAGSSFETISNDFTEGLFHDLILALSGASALTGLYSAVIFSLCVLYSKGALGTSADEIYNYVVRKTSPQRIRGYRSFVVSLILFSAEISVVLIEKFTPDVQVGVSLACACAVALTVRDWFDIITKASPIFDGATPTMSGVLTATETTTALPDLEKAETSEVAK